MARNFKQPGDVLDLTAPAGGVVSGTGYVIGSIFVVALTSAAAGETFQGKTNGVFELPKVAAVTPAQGAVAFFNNTTKAVTGTSAAGLFPIGVFTAATAGGDATAFVRLDGVSTAAAA
ncbi:hypothetical protein y223_00052 [Bordetella phage PY223]